MEKQGIHKLFFHICFDLYIIDFSFFHYTLTWLIRCGFDLLYVLFLPLEVFQLVYPCVCMYKPYTIWEWITAVYSIQNNIKESIKLSYTIQNNFLYFLDLLSFILNYLRIVYLYNFISWYTRVVSSSSNVHKRSINTLEEGVSCEVYILYGCPVMYENPQRLACARLPASTYYICSSDANRNDFDKW